MNSISEKNNSREIYSSKLKNQKNPNMCEMCKKISNSSSNLTSNSTSNSDSKPDLDECIDNTHIIITLTKHNDYICEKCLNRYYYLYENIIENQEIRYAVFLEMFEKTYGKLGENKIN